MCGKISLSYFAALTYVKFQFLYLPLIVIILRLSEIQIFQNTYPGKNVRRDPRLIPGGIPPEIGGIPPGIPPGIMEHPGRHPTWDPN